MTPVGKNLTKYLATYAAPEAAAAQALAARCRGSEYAHVLVIPARDEAPGMLAGYAAACRQADGRSLVIVVVNATVDASDAVHAGNAALLACLKSSGELLDDSAALQRRRLADHDLLLVDCASLGRRLPSGEGVGSARRIGADIALQWIATATVRSPWIHMTDADVTLPTAYFRSVDAAPKDAVAVLHPFWHEVDSATHDGIWAPAPLALYELSLRYHVLGLAAAQSPYAMQTLGSATSIDATAYAEVRGVPRLKAGEDFYLLDKLAKIGRIWRSHSAPLRISDRHSERVPFGTGPAVRRIAALQQRGETCCWRPPLLYSLLGAWLRFIDASCGHTAPPRLSDLDGGESRDATQLLRSALQRLGAEPRLAAAWRSAHSAVARHRYLHTWFDGLRTLQLLHALRDCSVVDGSKLGVDIPWHAALRQAEFLPQAAVAALTEAALSPPLSAATASLAELRQHLVALEAETPAECGLAR